MSQRLFQKCTSGYSLFRFIRIRVNLEMHIWINPYYHFLTIWGESGIAFSNKSLLHFFNLGCIQKCISGFTLNFSHNTYNINKTCYEGKNVEKCSKLKRIKFTSLILIKHYIQNICHFLNTMLDKKTKTNKNMYHCLNRYLWVVPPLNFFIWFSFNLAQFGEFKK